MNASAHSRRYCGRLFQPDELQRIAELVRAQPQRNRAQLSRLVCDLLPWQRPNGQRKEMSCRVALLRMQRDGLLRLPAPRSRNGNGRIQPRYTAASQPQAPISGPLHALGPLSLRLVSTRAESSLWNEMIQRYHYLRYAPLPGDQLRYLLCAQDRLLALLGFGAAAWSAAPRDRFIGWTPAQRKARLQLIVNNARFLILPWVQVPNLASHLLATVCRRLPSDWESRYQYRPVLLETFVQSDRFHATSYRAANWLHVGITQGRGKLDKSHLRVTSLKEIFLCPLHPRFREILCAP
jgi:hypothetical protein